MKAMLGTLLTMGAVGTFALCDLCGGTSSAARATGRSFLTRGVGTAAAPLASPRDTTVSFDVAGMTCGGCVIGVRSILTKLEGVKTVWVTYEPPRAVVRFDGRQVTVERIVAAIRTLGYTARPLPPSPHA